MAVLEPGEIKKQLEAISDCLHTVIVGHDEVIRIMCAAFCGSGHVLLEGVPGLGKTRLSAAFARASGLDFKKIQFTPDLMPADITGTHIITEENGSRGISFRPGPLFANIVLADEINRATPKTQSALLEAMQEATVTAGIETHNLPRPFMVIATQNPVEMKGTYPLPEAQKDRFMFKADLNQPTEQEIVEILDKTAALKQPDNETILTADSITDLMETVDEVVIAEHIREMAARAVKLTDPGNADAPEIVRQYVRLGSSVRGGQALIAGARMHALLKGDAHAAEEGILAFLLPALGHRLLLNFEAGADTITPAAIIDAVKAALKNS